MWTFSVLGPVEARAGGRRVALGGPAPRRLLTALVAAEGRPVSDDRLGAVVWAGRPPAAPAAALQVYVSRLRRALGDEGRDLLRRTSGGYQLAAAPGATDVERFVGQIDAGRELSHAGRTAEAVRAFDAALRLWRGEPFADLGEMSAGRARLRELKESAEEDRLAVRVAEPAVVAELEGLVAAAPYRERRWALLVRALYGCGRQADALATLRRVRVLLADDLGVDPGPELRQLEQQVLTQDPSLPHAARAGLTRPLSAFLGRDAELALLAAVVAAHRLVTVVGPAGVGKTRLAVEHAATRADPDGPWLVRLATRTDPAQVPSAIAVAMGLAAPDAESIGEALRGRQGVLLLDNCEHLAGRALADLVHTLLCRAAGLRVVATSRVPLGVDGERLVPLGPLPADQAAALLVDRMQAVRPDWAPDAGQERDVRQVVSVLDGIPLALELAAARAGVLGLRELARLLDDRFAALGAVPPGSLNPHATLEAAIAWSFDLLPDVERSLAIGLRRYEDGFSLEAATAILPAGTGRAPVEVLSSLVSRSVVVADTSSGRSRYRLLGSIRAYCRKLAEIGGPRAPLRG